MAVCAIECVDDFTGRPDIFSQEDGVSFQVLKINQQIRANSVEEGIFQDLYPVAEVFEQGEIKEAIDAAAAVGDDRIQSKTTGRISPETWTHGSSEQRVNAFNKGYVSGSLRECSL